MEMLFDETGQLKALIEKSKTGDYEAFRLLYDSLSGKMYSLCLRYISDKEEAADVFRDSFVKIISNLHHFHFEGSFEGWARKIFVSHCIDFIRKKKTRFSEETEDFSEKKVSLTALEKFGPEDLVKMIQRLPVRQRIVFNLFEIEGYSHKEIAGMLQITVSGSKLQLHRAKMLLKNSIID